ncbi:sugar kinase [Loktanella salsilacus]|uniref:sugar kinase n=1 Tax=Loktanella salsilacus TaxID=195913 RepID=UPI003736A88C
MTSTPILSPTAPSTALRFLSIGECMVEMAPGDAPGAFQMGFAGDTFNTAWYMRALRPDIATQYFTKVGTDAVSDAMLKKMTDAGIDVSHVVRSKTRTVGLYMISLDQGERSFSYWRSQSAARQLADDTQALAQAMGAADLIYLSGITIAILDPAGRDALLDAIQSARRHGKTVAFDSNLRPRLWANQKQMTSAVMRFAQACDIVLPSFDDEAAYFGDATIQDTLDRYRTAGATTVVVKNGAGQVLYWHAGQSGTVTPPPVPHIVDTTSAGDSFNAGFFAGLDREMSMEDRILAASHVAAQVIGAKGALVELKES